MVRRLGVTLALVLFAAACNTPPELPPSVDAIDASLLPPEDSAPHASSVSCQDLGGHCVDPAGACPIQITGKNPCGTAEGGPSGKICCTGG